MPIIHLLLFYITTDVHKRAKAQHVEEFLKQRVLIENVRVESGSNLILLREVLLQYYCHKSVLES